MGSTKFECDVPGFEDCFVEYSDEWTRGEIRNFLDSTGEEYLKLISTKILNMRVRTVKSEVTNPKDISERFLDDLKWEVFRWFIDLPKTVVQEVVDLGEVTRRQSSQARADSQNES